MIHRSPPPRRPPEQNVVATTPIRRPARPQPTAPGHSDAARRATTDQRNQLRCSARPLTTASSSRWPMPVRTATRYSTATPRTPATTRTSARATTQVRHDTVGRPPQSSTRSSIVMLVPLTRPVCPLGPPPPGTWQDDSVTSPTTPTPASPSTTTAHHDLCVIGSGSGNTFLDERFEHLSVAMIERGPSAAPV